MPEEKVKINEDGYQTNKIIYIYIYFTVFL